MSASPPTVAIVQKSLAHYRLPFYRHLRDELTARGIELRLIYGQTADHHSTGTLDWATPIQNVTLPVGERTLYWQPCLPLLQGANLVIVEQASKLLLNYVLLARHMVGIQKLAFWGHGHNVRVREASRTGEAVKAFMSRRVHWWFAYNAMSSHIVSTLGFPPRRITNVQNAIDTRHLIHQYEHVPDAATNAIKQRLGLTGSNVGLYVGSMYPAKQLPLLVQACERIRQEVPDFEMVFAGDGPEAGRVAAASEQHTWMHYIGPVYGAEKAAYFKLAKLLLMPGVVGLAVLDAFATETPLVTTNDPSHSPEIDYLISGTNGEIVHATGDAVAYARAVVRLLRDEPYRLHLVEGCRTARGVYTVEDMARRFSHGIQEALACP